MNVQFLPMVEGNDCAPDQQTPDPESAVQCITYLLYYVQYVPTGQVAIAKEALGSIFKGKRSCPCAVLE